MAAVLNNQARSRMRRTLLASNFLRPNHRPTPFDDAKAAAEIAFGML
jgi:hypothetical protein